MNEEWNELPLEECMEEIIDYRGKTPQKTSYGIPLITAKIIKGGVIQPITEFIAEDDYDSWMRRGIPKPGDIVMTSEAPLGEIAQLDDRKVALAQRVFTLRGKEEIIDNTFLKYLMLSQYVQHQLDGRASGTTVKGIKQSELRKINLKYPSLVVQKSIAHILGTLDDKIHLNRQINTTLESMAQTLFQSWFVHFDPVIDNALAEGNPIPEPLHGRAEARKALGEGRKPLPEAVRGAFPSRFVFSEEMGWIPEGWGVKPLVEITTELRRGISPKYIEEEGVRVVNQKCIRDHLINFSLTRRNDEKKKKIDGRELTIGDVLVNSTGVGTLGRMAQVYYLDETTVVDSHVTVVRADQEVVLPYIFGRMMLNIEPRIEAMGEGSTGQTELSRVNLQAFSVLVPSKECQIWVEEFFKGNAQKIVKNIREIETLKTFRDTLLPKLLSGDLDISAFL